MSRDFEASFSLLKELIPFDAAQLLRLEQGKRPQEVFRTGYSSTTAWALAHMFPVKYPGGFTQLASADAPLPPTISTATIRGEFTRSELFRDYLNAEGYAEGMTLELYTDSGPIGMAHFSSRTPRSFEGNPRKAALAVSGLLGHLVDMVPESDSPAWPVTVDASLKEALEQDEEFREHVQGFQKSPLAFVEHLWWLDNQLVYVGLVQPGHAEVRVATAAETAGLTRQEIQVLSILCCGVSDAEIASRLHLSIRTVQSHVGSLRRKLGAESRLEAAIIALGAGIYVPHPRWAPLRQIARGRLPDI
jgi:DNA-binding CsgD family transcriptional regulator